MDNKIKDLNLYNVIMEITLFKHTMEEELKFLIILQIMECRLLADKQIIHQMKCGK